ncbi:hypothetical protein Y032_0010g1171 [Ancylostoma ceylanicum]|uniref:Uncharacterized protein n=1 Tax=Ancylostoma ceylanicum TaxID=53326 RepID=A0A016VHH9_9BILA|nr:hypothetical protein Y032_0010g1171 [Ancylostoma ceylanicum]
MHVGVISLYRELLLLQLCCHLISEACTIFDKGSGLKMTSLQQFSLSDLSGTLGNLFSSVTSVAGIPLNALLPLETLSTSSSECPMECLTTLTAYTDKQRGIYVMLRAEDVRQFVGYTALDAPAMLCARSQGYCGADVPLFLYYSDQNRDYYIGLKSNIQPTYSVQYQGSPLCYVWTNSSYSTTTTTTTATSSTTTVLSVTFDNTTTAYNATTSSTFTTSSNWTSNGNTSAAWNSTTTTQPSTTNLTSPTGNITSTTTVATTTVVLGNTTVAGLSTTTLSTTTTTVTGSTTTLPNTNTSFIPETTDKSPHGPKKKSFNFWPLVLAGMVGLGVLVITIGSKFILIDSIFQLALSTITIIRSGRRALIRPQKNSRSPPPPYPYNLDGTSDLPPAPVSSMSAPQPFTVNPTMDIPFVPPTA